MERDSYRVVGYESSFAFGVEFVCPIFQKNNDNNYYIQKYFENDFGVTRK